MSRKSRRKIPEPKDRSRHVEVEKAVEEGHGELYRRLDFIIYLFVVGLAVILPTIFSARTVESGNIKDLALGIIVLAAISTWALRTILWERTELSSTPLNLTVLTFWGVAVASFLLSSHPSRSLTALWRVSLLALTYLLVCNFVRTRKRVIGFLTSASVGAIAVLAYAHAQKCGYDPFGWSEDPTRRVFSSLGNPNVLAGYVVIMMPLVAGLTLALRGRIARTVGILTLLSCGGCLVITETKGSWLACLVSAAVFGLCIAYGRLPGEFRWTRAGKRLALAALSVCLLGLVFVGPLAVRHFKATFPQSARVRLIFWKGALVMFRDHPMVGAGIGTFQIVFPRYRAPDFRAAGVSYNTIHAHSEYLETLGEQGILGTGALLLLIGAAGAVGFGARRRAEDRADRWLLCALLAAAAGTLSHGVVSVVLRWTVGGAFLWITFGLIAAMANVALGGKARKSYAFRLGPWQRAVACLLCLLLAGSAGYALTVRPFRAQLRFREGFDFGQKEKWDEAVGPLRAAIAQDKLLLSAYYELARAYWRKGDSQKSLEAYLTLREYAPDYAQLRYNMGVTYIALGRPKEACVELLGAVKSGTISPKFKLTPLSDLVKRTKKGKDEYVALLSAIVEENPRDKVAWSILGLWHQERKELDEAARCYQKAVEADERFVPALNNLAGIYYEKGELDKAVEVCQRVIAIDPKRVRAHLNLGRIYLKKGERPKALEHWRIVLSIDPDNAEAKGLIGDNLPRPGERQPTFKPPGGR